MIPSIRPLMFHNMPGFDNWRLTDILIKDRAGQAAALGLNAANEVCPYLAEQMATKRGKSVMVNDGPVTIWIDTKDKE